MKTVVLKGNRRKSETTENEDLLKIVSKCIICDFISLTGFDVHLLQIQIQNIFKMGNKR
jgi:hypothetical protein